MKLWLATLLIVIFAGCSRDHAPLQNRTSSHELFITNYGQSEAEVGLLTVKVSEHDGKLEIIRGQHTDVLAVTNPPTGQVVLARDASITNTYSSQGWKAQSGWFVFVENATRVWAYDGDQFLWLLQMDKVGNSGSYGPRSFPCRVPDKVLSRISAAAKNRITNQGGKEN